MIKSLILATASKYLLPMLLLFAAFLLLRGHEMPGGGFTGGLVAAAGISLHGFAFGMSRARRQLHASPLFLIACGLFAAMGSGIFALVSGRSYLTGMWWELVLGGPEELIIGTPLLFDLGVFLVVLGATLTIIFALGEED